ncbi:MAG: NUDIX hydrolase [Patescibacteria group bacterium]
MDVIPSVAVLIIEDNKVLLVKHAEKAGHLTGAYGLPSGRMNAGETEREAAVRELSEETGLKTKDEDLAEFNGNYYVAEIERKDGGEIKFGWRVFLCKNYSGEIKNSDETVPEWIEINNLENYNLLPNIKNVVVAGIKFLK